MIEIRETRKHDYVEFMSRERLEIKITDGGRVVGELFFEDGEPEDNCISRNFSDVYNITGLMRYLYLAGKEGKPVKFIYMED